jgi:hypothetical protein
MMTSLLVVALVSSGLLVSSAGGSQVSAVISRSAIAPYRDFLARRSDSLCDDFTLGARARLASEAGGKVARPL